MTMVSNLVKTYHLHHHHNDKQQHQLPLPKKKFVTYAVYALIAVALLYLFVDPAAPPPPPAPTSSSSSTTTTKPSSSPASSPWIHKDDDELPAPQLSMSASSPSYQQGRHDAVDDDEAPSPPPSSCDYSDGEWVPDAGPPLYNGTTCSAIKDDGRSCTLNGRPDSGYVYWRWQPRRCDLPAFSAAAFLRWLRNRHVAFVGDSLARNQAESLVCLLSSFSSPELVRRSDGDGGRFRRWVFPDHNASISIFWSPFLLRGVEKSPEQRFNQVFLDEFDERWMSELAGIDAVVLSAGHWFRIPSVYHDGGRVVGCHGCNHADDAAAAPPAEPLNGTTPAAAVAEMSFFAVFRDAVRRTLAEIARRHQAEQNNGGGGGRRRKTKVVAMTTFSPSHFEGQWNEGAPCKKKPDKELGFTETEMRKIVVEEVQEAAASSAAAMAVAAENTMRFAAVDVTALANQRPDGHPGPYMRKNPFAGGNKGGRVQHDCLHWCMPGPVDTFNQILLQTILRF